MKSILLPTLLLALGTSPLSLGAQSVNRMGHPGVDGSSMDYYAIKVGDVQKIRPGAERLGLGPVVVRKP